MSVFSPTQNLFRRRRFWLAEALLVAAILAFGGFALMSEARLSPTELVNSISDFVGH